MNTATRNLSWMALWCAVSGPAAAQQPASPPAGNAAAPAVKSAPTAQSEAGDPRADSSSPTVEAPPPAAAVPEGGRAQPAVRAAAPGPKPASPGAKAGNPEAMAGNPEAKSGPRSAPRTDRLNLGTATVTGDREQPKVMYIVPWKRSDIGDLAGKRMNSLVDEILAPVDRDVFKREVVYYHAVQADTSQNGAPPKPAQQGEK